MTLQQIHDLIESDLARTDALIRARLRSEVDLAEDMARYVVEAGGKRLRASLVALCTRACGGPADAEASILLAAVMEYIHTATLLHDDVIDASEVRRGRPTAHRAWSAEAGVLAGDFFYSRAFEMIAEIDRPNITRTLASASCSIVEGELMELMYEGCADLSEERYLTIVEGKTAKLFEASCSCAGMLEEVPEPTRRALASYGRMFGIAFQVADDALDYLENNPEADKSVGDDLASRRMTLPLIEALRTAPGDDRALLREALAAGDRARVPDVCAALRRSGALDYTLQRAGDFATDARAQLSILPPSPWRDALEGAADLAVSRRH